MDERVIFCENSKWISKTLGPFLAVHDLVDSRDYGNLVILENLTGESGDSGESGDAGESCESGDSGKQRPKNPYSKLALLSGKILRVRKIFARMRKKLF